MKLHEAIGLELERREKILHESLECGHDLVEEQPCAQCRLEARIEALESQNKQLLERRDTEYLRMLEWRGIDGIENACERCGGSGTAVYGSTSTWRGGAGGQMITSDICDRCWGSGDKSNKWTNLRRLPRLQPPEREGE